MKKLTIKMTELEMAFENNDYEIHFYLDTTSGAVLMVTDEVLKKLEDILAQYGEAQGVEAVDLVAVLPQVDLPQWQHEELLAANRIQRDNQGRYLAIPTRSSREDYDVMHDFIDTVEDERLAEHLCDAIRGRGAFRYFRDVIYDYPTERNRWLAYKDGRLRAEMINWLARNYIELRQNVVE